ncbi:MAG: Gfo/Idh/MocA family oxidoreductase [Armatimonadota bacterium]
MAKKPVTAVIVGAGHRGVGYGSYSFQNPDELQVLGVADPDDVRRKSAAEKFDIPDEHCFRTAQELADHEQIADAVINGTMDQQHVPTAIPLLEAGYDMLLEKPICTSRDELIRLLATVRETGRKLLIGHVLRHAPFYVEIRNRVAAGEIGEIMSVNTTERVSYHHMAVAFIRGKWNQRETSNPFLMAKCCHDLDLICWMKSGIAPERVGSFGSLMYFTEESAPEGSGTRCLVDCKIEEDCPYSARKHYIEQGLWPTYAWDNLEHIEDPTEEQKLESLRTDNPHGRCVWRCDNTIVDHQNVIIEFEDGATATHVLTGGTARASRTMHLVGTEGEIEGDLDEGDFVIRHPDAREGHEYEEIPVEVNVSGRMHGGGDMRLVADFVRVLQGEEPSLSTTDIMDSVYSHMIAFAADEAMQNNAVVDIEDLSAQ